MLFSVLEYFRPFHRYVFELIAKQHYDNRLPAISTALVQINLKNANVNRPRFVEDTKEFYISETALPGTKFATVYAVDDDNDTIVYSISPNTLFSIDSNTGVLRLDRSIETSPKETYISVNIAISDLLHETHDTFTISITTVNRHSPIFSGSICGGNISLREDVSLEGNVMKLRVIDMDRGKNGEVDIMFPPEQSRTSSKYEN